MQAMEAMDASGHHGYGRCNRGKSAPLGVLAQGLAILIAARTKDAVGWSCLRKELEKELRTGDGAWFYYAAIAS